MESARKLTLAELNSMDAAAFTAALGEVCENATWIVSAAAARRPFASVDALRAALRAAIRAAPVERQTAFVAGHPDLAGKAARAGDMTDDSVAEQAGAGLDSLTEAGYARFHALNDAYRRKFGFPFIVCVRRHSRDSILATFERRLAQSAPVEFDTALGEIDRIVALRLDTRVEGVTGVHGRLSTHVLDTHLGQPAPGVAVELRELSDSGAPRVVARMETNADGRTDAPLIGGRPLPIGRYEVTFAIGAYFAARGLELPEPPFLDVVPLRFGVAEAEGHYHVPLLATPWSYATYRGS
ncbi:MAG: 2-oxo-4-hydroxy-4-carboxy-5-ureidoimidazoline decarboxylase [Rhodospirillales bacterium]|nr:MAG: 2-oxo-4-hydroxy-4-carboxy-5-ureidoimidazoline decarboxylase [Rhodospirillales bacterium]